MSTNGKHETDAVILSGARTPIGKYQGALAGLDAPRLGAVALQAAVERAGIDPLQIEEVLMGQVVPAGSGQAPGRRAAILAGLPAEVGATSVNKVCGSGLKAVMLAAQAVRAGDADLLVAGGMESMSAAPYLVRGRQGLKFGHQQLEDSLVTDGLWCAFENWMMGNAAEFIADEYEVTRGQMDEFALASHQKAVAAIEAGKFREEIIPVEIGGGKGGETPKSQAPNPNVGAPSRRDPSGKSIMDTDECPRRDTSLEALAKLKPAFQKDGKVTAGNAPGLNDGGAAIVVASRTKAEAMGKQPMARIVGYAQAAVEPKWLFIAPAKAIPKLLDKIGWTLKDVDLIELNEAFAAQVLADGRALADRGWDWSKVNVNGGAIALGHPVGASGARVLITLMHALKDRGLKRGVASLCLGGGEAVALAVEME